MTQSERLIFALYDAFFDANSVALKLTRHDALKSIEWYVNTARASPAWIKAALKANPAKLLDYMGNGSIQDQIERATAYLRRYCRLPV